MYIPLKIRFFNEKLCLPENGFVASHLYGAPLMEGQSTEAASAKASPIADQRKLDFRDGRHAAKRLIGGMISSHIGQIIHFIHLIHSKRRLWRILHYEYTVGIRLHQYFTRTKVRIFILYLKAFGILCPILLHGIELW